ncbi:hypothetical protein V1506DRAFT_568628 [Lipomyces tetrasporus]
MKRGLQSRERRNPVSDQADEHGKQVKLDKTTPITDLQVRSNYNEAFTLPKENTPKQRLDVQLPYDKFLQLDQAFSELKSAEGISEDQRYPSLAHNNFPETVTVVTCPSSIHEGSARWIDSEIKEFIKGYLSTRSPHTLRNILHSGSTTQSFGHGEYTRSRKEPYGTGEMMIAIEVATSETYGKVLDDKDIWINGKGVNVAYLRAEKLAVGQSLVETVETNIALEYYGPLEYMDHKWVGELSEAFIEVWRPDSQDRFDLIQDGFELAHEYLPVTLNLKISNFYPHDEWQTANIEDNIMPFDSGTFLNSAMHRMKVVAQNRLELYLHEKWKLR